MAEVGVIVRTRDRPATLGRALASIAGQTCRDWQIALVNDGGDREALERFVNERSVGFARRVTFVHHEAPRGRWAAANAGVAALDCRYLVIHDDDDTWEPAFLVRTTEELSRADDLIGGVMSRTMEVFEKIVDGKPVIERNSVFKPEMTAITIANIAQRNQIVPISLLYRRKVHDEVGFYDETLPVLGDWEFYLRLLRRYDIRLIDEPLANWHKRIDDLHSEYSNSVVGRLTQHHETEARIRNQLLRQDLDAGIVGIGTLVSVGQQNLRVTDFAISIMRRLAFVGRTESILARGAASMRNAIGRLRPRRD